MILPFPFLFFGGNRHFLRFLSPMCNYEGANPLAPLQAKIEKKKEGKEYK